MKTLVDLLTFFYCVAGILICQVLVMITLTALFGPRFWCWQHLHRWDSPGGHCENCGACDEFFGPHHHEAKR